ncbi:MAG: indole-3-glycerol phosphate synthase TrpC [Proteobacteria bacterium]|nr:indole-3-glycerol phosphate synthase TrpC [Pseudomonadota bacterium]MBU6426539.1 indole-3-glycerol phosphate synthase TrpC [Rhodospirillales bacterium]
MNVMVNDILAKICADKRAEIAALQADKPVEDLKAEIRDAGKTRGFGRALMDAAAAGRPGLITEIKKASPSGGLIRTDFEPETIARAYEAAGAACLSVLTDEKYFQGSATHLRMARAAVELPVLRKDFMLDEYQIYESRAMGADCILLIMAALEDSEARDLEGLARALDMDVLVEVHNEEELERALPLQTPLLGVNNRNLKTMVTDIAVTEALSVMCPPNKFLISESGIRTNADVERLRKVCVQGFLVGESLMREQDVGAAVRALLGA